MKYLTIYTMYDAGIPMYTAKNIFDRIARYIDPFHVQVHRPVILKDKATTTTVTLRAIRIDSIEQLIEDRLINPRRSVLNQWVELKQIIEMLKTKDKQ